jgi:hypothetical protein
MFKVGDIVRCITDKYGITTYKRPCEVVEILSDDKIDVRCLGSNGSTFDVATKLFELVPPDEVLTKGMYVKDDEGELFKFIGYSSNGIHVSHPTLRKDFIFYDDIRYIKKFTI